MPLGDSRRCVRYAVLGHWINQSGLRVDPVALPYLVTRRGDAIRWFGCQKSLGVTIYGACTRELIRSLSGSNWPVPRGTAPTMPSDVTRGHRTMRSLWCRKLFAAASQCARCALGCHSRPPDNAPGMNDSVTRRPELMSLLCYQQSLSACWHYSLASHRSETHSRLTLNAFVWGGSQLLFTCHAVLSYSWLSFDTGGSRSWLLG